MQDSRAHLIAVFVITALFGYLIAPIPNKPKLPVIGDAKIDKGIDLAGGAELRYRALFDGSNEKNRREVTQGIVDVIENRIKQRKALYEPRITTTGEDMIVIQIPSVDKDALTDFRKLIEGIGKLEFRVVADPDMQKRFTSTGVKPDGWDVFLNTEKGAGGEHGLGPQILLRSAPAVTGADISDASAEPNIRGGGGRYLVNFSLHQAGARQFDEAAKELYNRPQANPGWPRGLLAIILDGEIQSMPQVNAESFHGKGEITGGFDKDSGHHLAIILKSGSLPVPIGRITSTGMKVPKEPESENFVGPSLGQDSIMRGMAASILGIILVALFMIVYYRAGGVVSVIGLVINLVWLLGIMALFGATMTLPGIAGIVLTIGMAVDANILIYERVREEMAKGKTASQAFDAGYDRAFSAIADSNVTSLLAGLVLYYFGSGAVKGFAVTLVIGIITTLGSVLWACKALEHTLVTRGVITQWSMMQLFKTPSVDWIKLAKPSVIISLIVAILGIGIFVQRGKEQFGIEFTGGTSLSFTYADNVDINDVRNRIGDIKENGVPKYPDAEIMTMASTTSMTKMALISGAKSREFQLRTRAQDAAAVRADIMAAFNPPDWKGPPLFREPFEELRSGEIPANDRWATPKDSTIEGLAGKGLWMYLLDDGKLDFAAITTKITERLKAAKELPLTRDATDNPIFGGDASAGTLAKEKDSPPGLARVKICLLKRDADAQNGANIQKVREELKALAATGAFHLVGDPFTGVQTIGPAVASQFMNTTILALLISAVLMIIYIAIRFHFFIFGVAAVIALTHDAVITLGFMSLAGWIVPKSWGLSFELNMSTFAALLTIVGYSVNDKIVTFDRIRENLALLKKEESFGALINRSINETIARSVLTSVTVWITCMILYVFTMTSAGGIASFSFPMLMGVIISMYSSINIASPILLWLFGGKRPKTA